MGNKPGESPVSQVDLYVKKMVYQDALDIAFKARSDEEWSKIQSRYKSMTRLYNFKNKMFLGSGLT